MSIIHESEVLNTNYKLLINTSKYLKTLVRNTFYEIISAAEWVGKHQFLKQRVVVT